MLKKPRRINKRYNFKDIGTVGFFIEHDLVLSQLPRAGTMVSLEAWKK
jgi:hypothetical protein